MPKKDPSLHPHLNRNAFLEFLKDSFQGMPPQFVAGKPITGILKATTRGKITRKLNTIIENSKRFKIGVTGDAAVRADYSDYRGTFKYIQMVYSSTSEKRIKDAEVEIIKKFMKSHPKSCKNKHANRAGNLTTYNSKYFVYVVYS